MKTFENKTFTYRNITCLIIWKDKFNQKYYDLTKCEDSHYCGYAVVPNNLRLNRFDTELMKKFNDNVFANIGALSHDISVYDDVKLNDGSHAFLIGFDTWHDNDWNTNDKLTTKISGDAGQMFEKLDVPTTITINNRDNYRWNINDIITMTKNMIDKYLDFCESQHLNISDYTK